MLAPPGASSVEALVLEHSGNTQRFNNDGAVGLGKHRVQLVDVMCSDVLHSAVQPRDLFIDLVVLA